MGRWAEKALILLSWLHNDAIIGYQQETTRVVRIKKSANHQAKKSLNCAELCCHYHEALNEVT